MRRTPWSVIISLLVVFCSGAVVGGFGHYLYTTKSVSAKTRPRSPEEYRQKYIKEMRGRLKMSDDQVVRLEAILDETRAKFREFRERTKPEMKRIQDDQVERIRGILNDAQRTEYEHMRQEREARSRGGDGC
jgi:uncharacterized membrane protein